MLCGDICLHLKTTIVCFETSNGYKSLDWLTDMDIWIGEEVKLLKQDGSEDTW